MKQIILAAMLLLAVPAVAQNGTYKVTNKHELRITALEERLSSSDINITPDDPRTSLEDSGTDTSTLIEVLAEYLMQEYPDAAELTAGLIPAQVMMDENNVFITGEKGDIIQAYPIREVKGGGTQWVFLCENNIVIRLYDLGNGRYTLSVPKMERLEMRKIK